MASNASATSDSVCLVCYESSDLRVVDGCEHRVCNSCLTRYQEEGKKGGNEIGCPLCVAFGPSQDEVVELVAKDSTPEMRETDVGLEPARRENVIEQHIKEKCTLCLYGNKQVDAVALCLACDQVFLCETCTDTHATTPATKEHPVLSLIPTMKCDEDQCQKHGKALNRFCETCKVAICPICVIMEHGDHVIKDMAEVVKSKMAQVREELTRQETRLSEYEQQREDLVRLNELAKGGDREAVLLTELEEHGEKLFESVLRWKEEIKKDLKEKFSIISKIEEALKYYTEFMEELKQPLLKARKLLSKPEQNTRYIDRLDAILTELRKIKIEREIDIAAYSERLDNLLLYEYTFDLVAVSQFGEIVGIGARLPEVFQPKLMSEHEVHSSCRYISMIGNKHFAAAFYDRHSKTFTIYIYELPFTLKHRFTSENLCDMAATPDGKLAVMRRQDKTSAIIDVYDTDTCRNQSSMKVSSHFEARGMAVTRDYHFVVLCQDDAKGEMIAIDQRGRHHLTCQLDLLKHLSPAIACGGRLIFVITSRGLNHDQSTVEIHEMTHNIIKRIKTIKSEYFLRDIKATARGDIFLTADKQGKYYLMVYERRGYSDWICKSEMVQGSWPSFFVPVVAANDGHTIAWSCGKTIKLYHV